MNSALILADKPTGNLETQNSSEVIAVLKETAKKYGRPILGGAAYEKLS